MTKNFKQFSQKLIESVALCEAFIEKDDHLEVTLPGHQNGKYAGTAIENRGNHAAYGEHGIAGAHEEIRSAIKTGQNSALRVADQYSRKHLNQSIKMDAEHPASSLRKQYVIGKTYEKAAQHDPEYEHAVFSDYQKNRPDIVKAAGAHDYNSLVQGSYHTLARETSNQFDHMPVKMQYHAGHMGYHNSQEMLLDVHGHSNLTVFRGGDRHEFLHHEDPETGVNENEKFRAVHDYFGHAIHGNQFGPKGEEIAWNVHRKMYSGLASVGMTSETRGQNSYVNYSTANLHLQKGIESHYREHRAALNRGDVQASEHHLQKAREVGSQWNYAQQASVVLPTAMLHPHYDGHVPHHIAHLLVDPASKTNPVYDTRRDHLGLVSLSRHHNTTSHRALRGGGKLDAVNAHEDLKHIASVHGYSSIDRNPFHGK